MQSQRRHDGLQAHLVSSIPVITHNATHIFEWSLVGHFNGRSISFTFVVDPNSWNSFIILHKSLGWWITIRSQERSKESSEFRKIHWWIKSWGSSAGSAYNISVCKSSIHLLQPLFLICYENSFRASGIICRAYGLTARGTCRLNSRKGFQACESLTDSLLVVSSQLFVMIRFVLSE